MARKLIKKDVGPIRHNHIYNIEFEKASSFIKDCLSLDNTTLIESLDCHESIFRVIRKDLSIQDVLDIIFDSPFKCFSFILRKGFSYHKFGENPYWEFCASGMKDSVEYFFWIEAKEESGYKLVEKYNLKKNDEM